MDGARIGKENMAGRVLDLSGRRPARRRPGVELVVDVLALLLVALIITAWRA